MRHDARPTKRMRALGIAVGSLVLVAVSPWLAEAGLLFEKDGAIRCEITEDGYVDMARTASSSGTEPTIEALVFSKGEQRIVWVEPDYTISVTGDVNTQTSAFAGTGLVITNESGLQVAELTAAGDLDVKAKYRELVNCVSYVGDEAVYTLSGEDWAEQELAYTNMTTPGGPEGRVTNDGFPTTLFYVTDHLGSTRAVIMSLPGAQDPVLLESMAFHVYGGRVEGANATDGVRECFTGKEWDGASADGTGANAYYFGRRFYDADVGRWLSVDPRHEFVNGYAYHMNPLSYKDPDGEEFALAAAITSAIIAAGVATLQASAEAGRTGMSPGEWLWNVFWQSNVAGAFGFLSGGIGGTVGKHTQDLLLAADLWPAVAASTIGGGVVGGMGGYGAGLIEYGKSGNVEEVGRGVFGGLGLGIATGALSPVLRYGADRTVEAMAEKVLLAEYGYKLDSSAILRARLNPGFTVMQDGTRRFKLVDVFYYGPMNIERVSADVALLGRVTGRTLEFTQTLADKADGLIKFLGGKQKIGDFEIQVDFSDFVERFDRSTVFVAACVGPKGNVVSHIIELHLPMSDGTWKIRADWLSNY